MRVRSWPLTKWDDPPITTPENEGLETEQFIPKWTGNSSSTPHYLGGGFKYFLFSFNPIWGRLYCSNGWFNRQLVFGDGISTPQRQIHGKTAQKGKRLYQKEGIHAPSLPETNPWRIHGKNSISTNWFTIKHLKHQPLRRIVGIKGTLWRSTLW